MGRQLLADRRVELGMTREQVAHKLGCAVRTYQRWEQGVTTPRPGQRPGLARVMEWSMGELAAAIDPDRSPPDGHEVPSWLNHLASLEQGASQIWAWEPFVIHGLLQTPRYARTIEQADPRPSVQDDITKRVELRIARQEVLTREERPLELTVVLAEAVLHNMAGDQDTMAEQLEHLCRVGQLPHVTIRVLPFTSGAFSGGFGAFKVLSKLSNDGDSEPYMACVEDRVGPHYLDRLADLDEHVSLFRHLVERSCSPADSADLIDRTSKELYL